MTRNELISKWETKAEEFRLSAIKHNDNRLIWLIWVERLNVIQDCINDLKTLPEPDKKTCVKQCGNTEPTPDGTFCMNCGSGII